MTHATKSLAALPLTTVVAVCYASDLVQSGELMTSRSGLPVSISFPSGVYQALQNIAKQKKVSLAWVVRDAAEKYVAGETDRQKRPARSHVPSA